MNTKYDIIIAGGGTAGCAAAYTAGKLGLKTLVLEKNIHLGGSITSGLVIPVMRSGKHQINTEFKEALCAELHNLGGQVCFQDNPYWFNPELTKIALDNLMAKAGVDVLFGAQITGVNVEGRRIKSIEVNKKILSAYNSTLENFKEKLSVPIEASYIIDTTGNCEIGKICGCNFLENNEEFQPVSLRFMMSGIDLDCFGKWLADFDSDRNVTVVENIGGETHLSTAYTWDKDKKWALAPLFKDAVEKNILKYNDTNYFQVFTTAGMSGTLAFNCPRIIECGKSLDSEDLSSALLLARQAILRYQNFCKAYFPGFENAYISNIADMIGIRASSRLKGKYIYTIDDLKSGKKFDNPVVISDYPVDVHSDSQNSSTLAQYSEYQLPIEALMSYDIDNLFVAGRCLSADYMAQGALRVQASCFSMGEGVAKYISEIMHL